MREGEIAIAELERPVFGVVSLNDADHESVLIDESFADRARLDLALSTLQPDTERAIRLRFGSLKAFRPAVALPARLQRNLVLRQVGFISA